MHHNKEEDKAAYRDWATKVSTGVAQIINGRRTINEKAKLDLCACLVLLDGKAPLPFDWDITLYTEPPALRAPRLPTAKVGPLPGDKGYKQYVDPEEDDDDGDLDDPIARPKWNLGEVQIVKMTAAPFWIMARYIDLNAVCDLTLRCVRMAGLPYKRDGFWMGTVQRLYPQNKTSNWAGAWLADGPPSEIFASVLAPALHKSTVSCVHVFVGHS